MAIFFQNERCLRDCPRESVFADRRKRISETCKAYGNLTDVQYTYITEKPTVIVGKAKPFVYCAITKPGSSVWKRVLSILEYGKDPSFMFNWYQKLPRLNDLTGHSRQEMEHYFETATHFQFVREPYGRLFSAYHDKLFRPNVDFWGNSGRHIIKEIRANASEDSLEFGHDVTFTEIIKFLVWKVKSHKMRLNEHFAPMYSVCNPCVRKQLYLGKLETFVADASFIISKIATSTDNEGLLEPDAASYVTHAAHARTKALFELLDKTKQLKYPKRNLFLRTWRDFQIRGLLSKTEDMPLDERDVENISQQQFARILTGALTKPTNQTLVKSQRREAMLQAYSTVPRDLLQDLAKFVEIDCALFGYKNKPIWLFDASNTPQNSFNYFDTL